MTVFVELAVSGVTGHVVGIVGRGVDGVPVQGAHDQTNRAIERLRDLLERHGAGMDSVVRLRVYLTEMTDWSTTVLPLVSAGWASKIPPCTVVGIAALVEPWMRVEFEVDIAMPVINGA